MHARVLKIRLFQGRTVIQKFSPQIIIITDTKHDTVARALFERDAFLEYKNDYANGKVWIVDKYDSFGFSNSFSQFDR